MYRFILPIIHIFFRLVELQLNNSVKDTSSCIALMALWTFFLHPPNWNSSQNFWRKQQVHFKGDDSKVNWCFFSHCSFNFPKTNNHTMSRCNILKKLVILKTPPRHILLLYTKGWKYITKQQRGWTHLCVCRGLQTLHADPDRPVELLAVINWLEYFQRSFKKLKRWNLKVNSQRNIWPLPKQQEEFLQSNHTRTVVIQGYCQNTNKHPYLERDQIKVKKNNKQVLLAQCVYFPELC